jgi:hypothetical protein
VFVFIGYAAFNLVALLFFFRYERKSIHVLEILTYWLVATILFQNYSAFFTMNLKYMIVPEQLGLELAHLLNRTVLYPVIVLIYLNRYAAMSGRSTRLLWTLSAILFLTGLEWLADWTDVLRHTREWQLWWSFAWWSLYLLLLLAVYQAFRTKLTKEFAYK